MTEDGPRAPALGEALSGWLDARKDTNDHIISNAGVALTREWIQHLADLLATEDAWKQQYTDLLGFGGVGTFPESQR
jgi:hypothetical protein